MFPPPASTLASPIAKTTVAQVVGNRQGRVKAVQLCLPTGPCSRPPTIGCAQDSVSAFTVVPFGQTAFSSMVPIVLSSAEGVKIAPP